ncbi:MAG TPA: FUSC family protein [Solirubrobacteraceae bacterium]
MRRLALEQSSLELRGRASARARSRWQALGAVAVPIAQCTVAAPVAWILATHVVGHRQAFFAPIAALIALGVGLGQRRRRAIELTIGVAFGIGVASLLVSVLGTGALAIAVVVALAMIGAILLAGPDSPLLVTQAAVAGVLVATIQPPTHGPNFTRFIDALIGGGVGLLATIVVPADPLKAVQRAMQPLLAELAGTLRDIGGALDSGDEPAASRALARSRAIGADHHDVIAAARDMSRLSPTRRSTRATMARYERGAVHVDRATRNTRVLARAAVRAVDILPAPPGGSAALEQLAAAVGGLRAELEEGTGLSDVRDAAAAAVRAATEAFSGEQDFATAVLLGQVRTTAVDLLRAAGMDLEEARPLVREAAEE